MSKLNLPSDLEDYLRAGKQLQYDPEDCEPGTVGLKGLAELDLGEVWIDGAEVPSEGDDEDPHSGEEGYYAVPAVSLTGECEGYDPDFILLWLPAEQMYGTWDSDHWSLLVFPDTDWGKIVRDPVPYVNAQWDVETEVAFHFQPWPKYAFTAGRPF